MPVGNRTNGRRRGRRSLPNVILLSSIDPGWGEAELLDTAQNEEYMRAGMVEQGLNTVLVRVTTAREIAPALRAFEPDEWVVMNWAESFKGISNGYWLVPPILERMGFTSTGSTAPTLKASQSKSRTMRMLARRGVPVPEWRLLRSGDDVLWNRFPAILKPSDEHCSFGITPDSVVYTEAQAGVRAEQLIGEFRQPVILSDYITGREFNVAIWGNGVPEILPIHELDFSAFTDERERMCSYDAKWVPGSRAWENMPSLCPAPVRGRLKLRVEEVALAAYQVMGLRDYGRIDMREQNGEVYVIDVNANCDITTTGGFARSARVAGYPYGAAMAHIVLLAAERRRSAREAYERAYENELTLVPDLETGLITAV